MFRTQPRAKTRALEVQETKSSEIQKYRKWIYSKIEKEPKWSPKMKVVGLDEFSNSKFSNSEFSNSKFSNSEFQIFKFSNSKYSNSVFPNYNLALFLVKV